MDLRKGVQAPSRYPLLRFGSSPAKDNLRK